MNNHETIHMVDLDVTEEEELANVVRRARETGGYLHVEIRREGSSDRWSQGKIIKVENAHEDERVIYDGMEFRVAGIERGERVLMGITRRNVRRLPSGTLVERAS